MHKEIINPPQGYVLLDSQKAENALWYNPCTKQWVMWGLVHQNFYDTQNYDGLNWNLFAAKPEDINGNKRLKIKKRFKK